MTHIININIIVLTLKAIWDTYVEQMHMWSRGDPTAVIAKQVRKLMRKNYCKKLRYEIDQLPHHLHTLKIHNPYKDARHRILEREKAVLPTYSCNRKKLKDTEVKAFQATWCKTNLVTLEGRRPTALHISPINMGLPQAFQAGDDGGGGGV